MVVIFLRGGADGLSMTPPTGAAFDSYRAIRPTINISPDQSLPLDDSNPNASFPQGMSGVIGLHPNLQGLYDTVWAAGRMAIVPAVGLPDGESRSRSHFEAQKFWDRGSASLAVRSGWLGRALDAQGAPGPVSGVGKSSQTSEMLRGAPRTFAVPDLRNFGVSGFANGDRARSALSAMHQGTGLVNQTGTSTLNVADLLEGLDAEGSPGYPSSRFARDLKQVAVMLKANIGLQAAVVDSGGWDHHDDLGAPGDTNGRFYQRSLDLGAGLSAFINDLGAAGFAETTIAVVSEFGRTIDENGSGGTDHGRGGTMFLIGEGVQGGVFANDYPDVIEEIGGANRRAIPVLTDYRQPLAELLAARVGVGNVYPTFTVGPALGVVRTT